MSLSKASKKTHNPAKDSLGFVGRKKPKQETPKQAKPHLRPERRRKPQMPDERSFYDLIGGNEGGIKRGPKNSLKKGKKIFGKDAPGKLMENGLGKKQASTHKKPQG